LVDYGVGGMSMRILSDSQCAIPLANNPIVSQRSKHIDVVHHFVWERVQEEQITWEYCNTQAMVADSLTKVVGTEEFIFCRAELALGENRSYDPVGVLSLYVVRRPVFCNKEGTPDMQSQVSISYLFPQIHLKLSGLCKKVRQRHPLWQLLM
jgi:hypothetical protein